MTGRQAVKWTGSLTAQGRLKRRVELPFDCNGELQLSCYGTSPRAYQRSLGRRIMFLPLDPIENNLNFEL